MYCISINPTGAFSVLNLDLLGVWRVALIANHQNLGIGVNYVTDGTKSFMFLCALDCLTQGNETRGIAAKGLPRDSKEGNIERLSESMKILFNAENTKEKEINELIPKSKDLVEVYYSVLEAIRLGVDASGAFEGWKWWVRKELSGWEF